MLQRGILQRSTLLGGVNCEGAFVFVLDDRGITPNPFGYWASTSRRGFVPPPLGWQDGNQTPTDKIDRIRSKHHFLGNVSVNSQQKLDSFGFAGIINSVQQLFLFSFLHQLRLSFFMIRTIFKRPNVVLKQNKIALRN